MLVTGQEQPTERGDQFVPDASFIFAGSAKLLSVRASGDKREML